MDFTYFMNAANHNKTITPPPLLKGDTIGLVAPAGYIQQEVLQHGIQLLKEAGLKVSIKDSIIEREAYLAGSDKRRLCELHELWDNNQIKAILAVRGGFGCCRLLDELDFALIKQKPKILIGFSDLTILLNAIYQKTGLLTMHGPMLSTLVRDGMSSLKSLLNTLTAPPQDIKYNGLEILRTGQAKGPLIGGNLACLTSMIGTPYEPAWEKAVLFIEDINEAPYRIDRMLSQLKMAGRLSHVSGIILGDFLGSDQRTMPDIELIWQRILELTDGIPVWANFPVGHGKSNVVLAVGAETEMDSSAGVLRFT